MRLRRPGRLAPVLLLATLAATRVAAFDLQFTLLDNASGFTAAEKILVQEALGRAERMWETVIVGYQNGANIISVPTPCALASSTMYLL